MLELAPFRYAIARLQLALDESGRQQGNDFIHDALILRFGFTYDLCPKMLRRFFAETEATEPDGEDASFPNLIRLASVRGLLLNGWDVWFDYRKARNITSHTYDRAKAQQVFSLVPAFLEDARHLRDRMAERLRA